MFQFRILGAGCFDARPARARVPPLSHLCLSVRPFLQILGGDFNPLGQGVRVNSTKYLKVRDTDRQSYDFDVDGTHVSFHFDKVAFFQKVRSGCPLPPQSPHPPPHPQPPPAPSATRTLLAAPPVFPYVCSCGLAACAHPPPPPPDDCYLICVLLLLSPVAPVVCRARRAWSSLRATPTSTLASATTTSPSSRRRCAPRVWPWARTGCTALTNAQLGDRLHLAAQRGRTVPPPPPRFVCLLYSGVVFG